jgi:hypothetical protein
VILRETLLRKGSPSNSLPKTFSIKFSPYRALHKMWKPVIYWERPVWAKFSYKVFGKGVRGKTFLLYGVLNAVNYVLSPRRSSSEIFIM